MSLKEMLKPSSRGDMWAVPSPFLMVLSVVLIQIYESYWCLIPLIFGFLLMGIGIKIDDKKRREKRKNVKEKNKDKGQRVKI